uniref:Uncharacterized protein n=1 Tax=viral metagenome TaxID=1070528 RepID=A0A6M3KY91_9ZZZZ
MKKFLKPYKLNPEVIRWVNSFVSCAIEGNKLAENMISLWNSGREDEFIRFLEDEWWEE